MKLIKEYLKNKVKVSDDNDVVSLIRNLYEENKIIYFDHYYDNFWDDIISKKYENCFLFMYNLNTDNDNSKYILIHKEDFEKYIVDDNLCDILASIHQELINYFNIRKSHIFALSVEYIFYYDKDKKYIAPIVYQQKPKNKIKEFKYFNNIKDIISHPNIPSNI